MPRTKLRISATLVVLLLGVGVDVVVVVGVPGPAPPLPALQPLAHLILRYCKPCQSVSSTYLRPFVHLILTIGVLISFAPLFFSYHRRVVFIDPGYLDILV